MMEKDIFNIIEEKDYNQLTAQELELVAEFCANEDEYRQMQHVLVGVNELQLHESESPRKETKDKLDDLFAAQNFPKTAPIWYNKLGLLLYPRDKKMHQRPLFQLAAIVVLLLGIIPFLMTSNQPFQKEQLAKNEIPEATKELDVNQDAVLTKEDVDNELHSEVSKEKIQDNDQSFMAMDEMANSEDVSSKPFAPGSDFKDMSMDATAGSISRSAASAHPDGIFMDKNVAKPDYSIALSEQADVLDLLTATF